MFNIGDLVTRNSYDNDIVFKIVSVEENIAYLIGMDYRLTADASLNDLCKVKEHNPRKEDEAFIRKIEEIIKLDRDEYFYLPGKILHIDSDKNYLDRCLEFYKKAGVLAYGIKVSENNISKKILKYLEDIRPDILVITGHDAYYENKEEKEKYKNSKNFIEGVKIARKFESDYAKLTIIAGACQSNYEELIKAGSTFASSPKRINIHALDPAIIATSISLSERGKEINIINILNKTKYGKDGMGGLKTNGMMFVGYPR